jgi:hypothetical protein
VEAAPPTTENGRVPTRATLAMIKRGFEEAGQASSDRHNYQVFTAAVSRSAFQLQGSSRSSSCALVRLETMRSSTSVNQAKGSTPFSDVFVSKRSLYGTDSFPSAQGTTVVNR